jgi:purine-nucleoside phosphorylase
MSIARFERFQKPALDHVRLARIIATCLWKQWQNRPRVAIVLGTGMANLASSIQNATVVPYEQLPELPGSTALGHRGAFVCGQIDGIDLIALDGRLHLYEGHSAERSTLGVRVACELGADILIVTNASGGLNPQFRGGELLVIADHINLMGWRTASLAQATDCPSRAGRAPLYDSQLIDLALASGRRHGFPCYQGVYVSVLGPNYETRAEYRFMRKIGGDAVGMSTVPEVLVAAQCGMRVLALSTITNVARPDAPVRVDAHEVVDIASTAEPNLRHIVCDVLRRVANDQAPMTNDQERKCRMTKPE